MALTPDATAETVPGYAFDIESGQWYRIGTGLHTHADYLPFTGGTIAPGPLNVPAPVSFTGAARLADANPRFANAAARDAAYAALPGGVQPGMSCFLIDRMEQQQWDGTAWKWMSRVGGSYIVIALRAGSAALPAGSSFIPMDELTYQVGPDLGFSGGYLQILTDGIYNIGTTLLWYEIPIGTEISTALGVYRGGVAANWVSVGGGWGTYQTYDYHANSESLTVVAGDLVQPEIWAQAAGVKLGSGSFMWAFRVA